MQSDIQSLALQRDHLAKTNQFLDKKL